MFQLIVSDVFHIRGRGTVVTGKTEGDTLAVGDRVQINGGPAVKVDAIEMFRKQLQEVQPGMEVGLLLGSIDRDQVSPGDAITKEGDGPSAGPPAPPMPDPFNAG
jgi:translation elongation factor EF-Tu-like GTPase